MAEVDDWQPVSAGVDDWQPVKAARPSIDTGLEVDTASPFVSSPLERGMPSTVPEAFLDRLRRGQAIDRVLGETLKGAQEGFGNEPIAGTDQHLEHLLQRLSIERADPTSKASPLQFDMVTAGVLGMKAPAMAPVRGLAMLADIAMRGINAGVVGAGSAIGQLVDEAGGEGAKVRKEAINFGNFLMIEGGMGRFSRLHPRLNDEAIGGLPKAEDFKTAAEIVHEPTPDTGAPQSIGAKFEQDMWHIPLMSSGKEAGRLEFILGDMYGNNADKVATIRGVYLTEESRGQGLATSAYEKLARWAIDSGRILKSSAAGDLKPTSEMIYDRLSDRGFDVRKTTNEFGRSSYEVVAAPAREASAGRKAEIVNDRRSNTEQHLRDLWEERGIHPAEALHDAQSDAFLRQEITRPFIDAYHASPYDFTEFDPTKVGTGEGSATFGHAPGGYHAENIGTHKTYLTTLGDATINGRPFDINNPVHKAAGLVDEFGSREAAIAEAKARIAHDPEDFNKQVLQSLESEKPLPGLNVNTISYRTRIHADREHFLDWDKLLSEQTPQVKVALARLAEIIQRENDSPGITKQSGFMAKELGDLSVDDFYRQIAKYDFDEKSAARMLAEAGIPGIKYLDQGSRAGGVGTSNLAVFGANLVEITHKNGIPLRDLPLDQMLEASQALPEAEVGRPSALGAEATGPLPDLATQPLPKPGRLVAAARSAIADTLGLARNIQFMLDPMSTGSAQAMVIAKDAISSVRRIDWEWSRRDQNLVDNFDREQRKVMFDRADEESVARQLGESREHQGLVTLEPTERLTVEILHEHAQAAWLHAVDVGLVEGEGLPAYTPRMVINIANALDSDGPVALNSTGRNVFTRTAQMRHRKYMTAEETEAAAKKISPEAELVRDIRVLPMATARLEKAVAWREMINHIEDIGKAAGDELIAVGEIPQDSPHGWFTIPNPAFRRVRPRFKEGAVVKDADGEIVFDRVPIYVRDDFKGPLTSIFDEAPSKHPAAEMSASAYQALMALKGKSMTVIMNSFLIHAAVVWGKVVPAAPGWFGFRVYFTGKQIKNDPVRAAELIERGLAPIGRRGSFQDISSVAEEPNLKPGRSTTSDVLSFIPGLFKEEAEVKVKEAIDKAGDFWHNTMLWDKVENAQFGLAQHLSDGLVRAGNLRIVADRIASHFSNMIVGSIPKEAMSGAARATANMLLFSRSFTLGNLQTFKTAAAGLPKPILAQIMRDMGSTAAEMEEVIGASGDYLKGLGRRRAMGTAARTALGIIAIDYVISKAINSVLQSSINTVVNDSTVSEEFNGYARRARELADRIKMDPFTLMHPLDMVEKLTPMSENEPQKANRIFIGYDKDGTALYGRNPMGKYPEEMVDWMTGPLDIMRRKMSPFAGGVYESFANDRGFGRKIFDPTAKTYFAQFKNMLLIGEHMVEKHLPMDQLTGLTDLIGGALGKDTGDQRANALRTFAPVAGFTVSHGAPGGMAKGELYSERDSYQAKFAIEWPTIRKQFQRGEVEEAKKGLAALGVSPRDQRSLERSALNPSRIGGQALQNFNRRATPEQRDRMDRAGERAP